MIRGKHWTLPLVDVCGRWMAGGGVWGVGFAEVSETGEKGLTVQYQG